MRSSTSSSSGPSDDLGDAGGPRVPLLDRRVWIGLLLVFALLELGTRVRLFNMSKDFRRFRTYPARARALVADPAPFRVALIGNSATDRGVDRQAFEAGLAAAGRPGRADLFVADQSRIDTWRFVFERYFAAPGLHPDLVVVTFYENDLEDGNAVEIGRLAQFFTTVRDWPEVMRVNLHGLDDAASFVVSSGWATYAASDRIRERLYEALVPDYQEDAERRNQIIYAHERAAAHARPQPPPSFVALGRLLDRAAEVGVPLCFVAYPTYDTARGAPYPLSAGLVELLRARGAAFVDLRRIPGLGPSFYADDVHLTEAGRRPYSEALAAAIAKVAPAAPTR
jgi:hypothetical protein